MQTPDLWGELFRRIDQLMLFTPAMAAVLPLEQRERFLSDIKEPCHAVAYDLGWTRYLPCSRMEPDDLIAQAIRPSPSNIPRPTTNPKEAL